MTTSSALFPAFPSGLKGRRTELSALARMVSPRKGGRIALVGSGGSGKSILACAFGHRVARRFAGGVHWFRSGPWDARTLGEMVAIRFGTSRRRERLFPELRAVLAESPPRFIVLDNHENDGALCAFFNEVGLGSATWVVTARRCLLGGVSVFPVIAPLASSGRAAFPRVRALAGAFRHSPLALDVADAIVQTGAVDVPRLHAWLLEHGIERVKVLDHEDDLPEVALLVEWAWQRLNSHERRIMTVLAHSGGDHMDADSVATLARVPTAARRASLARVRAWHLVQSPLPERYALHAVVRHAVLKRTRFGQGQMMAYYLDMLERSPSRLDLEQTHLYAAMDYAHSESKLDWMLRIERLLDTL